MQQVGVYKGSSEMTIINGRPVAQQVWHTEEPSLLNGAMSAEYRSKYTTFAGT